MADNIDVTPGTGKTVATDEIAGVNYQIIKLGIGADGAVALLSVGAGDVDTGTPRVTLAADDPAVTAINALNPGDASAANQTTIIGHVDGIEGKLDTLITSSAATQTASESNATVNVAQVTDVIKLGATDLTPKFAVINLSASADLLALVASKRIRIVSMLVMAAADVTLTLRSGGSTAISGVLPLLAKSGFVLPYNPVGWFQTASGEKLDAVLGGSVDVDGFFTYIEV